MALINTTTTGILGTTVYGDGAGALTVQQDGVTINKVTSQPIIDLSLSSNQTVTSGVWTKTSFDVKNIDTHSLYNTSTYKFTPNIAGYYYAYNQIYGGASTIRGVMAGLYKNGSQSVVSGNWVNSESYGDDLSGVVSKIFYMNGTTDYLEFYGYVYDSVAGSDLFLTYSNACAYLIRAV